MKRRKFLSLISLGGLVGIKGLEGKENNQDLKKKFNPSWEEPKYSHNFHKKKEFEDWRFNRHIYCDRVRVEDIRFVYIFTKYFEFQGNNVVGKRVWRGYFRCKGELSYNKKFVRKTPMYQDIDVIYIVLCDGKNIYDGEIGLRLVNIEDGMYEYSFFTIGEGYVNDEDGFKVEENDQKRNRERLEQVKDYGNVYKRTGMCLKNYNMNRKLKHDIST